MDGFLDILPLLVFFVLVAVNFITQRAKNRERRERPTAPARRSDAGSDFEVARMLVEELKRKYAEENGDFGKSDGGLGGEAGAYGGGMSDSDSLTNTKTRKNPTSPKNPQNLLSPRARRSRKSPTSTKGCAGWRNPTNTECPRPPRSPTKTRRIGRRRATRRLTATTGCSTAATAGREPRGRISMSLSNPPTI